LNQPAISFKHATVPPKPFAVDFGSLASDWKQPAFVLEQIDISFTQPASALQQHRCPMQKRQMIWAGTPLVRNNLHHPCANTLLS
jgi:hypothetical protein